MAEVIIEAKHLRKSYGEGEALFHALDDVSLQIYEHEFLVIIGGSGSGKSTLLNMIGGMDAVDSGQILFRGEDITKFNGRRLTLYRRNDVGYVYQFFNLLNDITVFQNVTLAPGADKNQERA
ncbi:MAG: ABC transporter ATP-binding protein, partial [Bacilli bacterium]|nr:ABC transporter ATP-binding protein [Bacilli bacterium]